MGLNMRGSDDFVREQRTPEGLLYDKIRADVFRRLRSGAKVDRDAVAEENERLVEMRLHPGQAPPEYEDVLRGKAAPSDVHINTAMSTLSVMYANDELIGLRAMPLVGVTTLSDDFYTYSRRDFTAVPSDALGHTGDANEVELTYGTDNYSCKGYGLKTKTSALTKDNADAPLDVLLDAHMQVRDLVALAEEIRIAAIVGAAGSYGSNTAAVALDWDDPTSNPDEDIDAAIDACWPSPNPTRRVGVMSSNVARVLKRHPKLMDIKKHTAKGPLSLQELAEHFELDEILVGRSRKDTANPGAAASYARIWPDVFAVLHVAQAPTRRSAHFGSTFRMGGVHDDQWFDISRGTHGVYWARVSVVEDHKVVAADTSYLLTGVIS